MSEPNGAREPGNDRLDRIERALNLMLDDHIQFREEHKLLLSAQVLMQGGLEELRKNMDSLTRQVETTSAKVERMSDRVDVLTADVTALTANVEAMRQNFDQRLKRIEQP
jgi:methyl-accepting chemotaxis protein